MVVGFLALLEADEEMELDALEDVDGVDFLRVVRVLDLVIVEAFDLVAGLDGPGVDSGGFTEGVVVEGPGAGSGTSRDCC